VWKDGGTINVTAIPNSQLAVVCIVDRDDPSSPPRLMLFHQSQGDAIHYIEYRRKKNKWSIPNVFHNVQVLNGTGLAAVVSNFGSGSSKIHLYCQDPGETLKEIKFEIDSDDFLTSMFTG
jgi:hypothetical protein